VESRNSFAFSRIKSFESKLLVFYEYSKVLWNQKIVFFLPKDESFASNKKFFLIRYSGLFVIWLGSVW